MTVALQDTKGRPITSGNIRTGLRINMGAGALGMMWFALALGMPVTMFMERLHAPAVAIGLMVTVQWLAMTMQIPSALLAERLTNRKRYWGTTSLLHRLLWFLPPLIPFICSGPTAGWLMLALIGTSSLLANASAAPWFSWMADLIPENQRNQFWARRQSLTQAAFLVAMGLGGWMLDRFSGPNAPGSGLFGFQLVFVIAALLGTADILIHMLIREPRPHPISRGESWHRRLKRPFEDPDFLWLTLAFGAWNFGLGLVGAFGFLYLRQSFHASYTHLAAFTVCGSLGTVLASPLWGKVMDHVGERTFALGILLVAPLFALQWFILPAGTTVLPLPLIGSVTLPAAVFQICLISIVSGALYTGVPLSQIVLASAVTRKEGRTLAMAVHWTLVGALGAIGPIIGGWVMDRKGLPTASWRIFTGLPFEGFHLLVLAHMAVSWFVALPLLARTRPRHGNLPMRALAGNPLRAAGLIHSLVTLGEASSSEARAKAVRNLGRKGSSHVVGELIEQLNDPSADVREAAVQSLGRIGSPPAVDALLQLLEAPDSDLSVQVARALREARDPRSVDALMRTLDSPDAEIRKESARSLGAIGDQRAAGTLLELVRASADMPLVTASSEALASLGEVAAIHQILRRMREARNPALRTSLAVAVADLLGAPGEFYPILMGERRQSGSQISDMLRAIRVGTRRAAGRPLRQDANRLRGLSERVDEALAAGNLGAAAQALFDLALAMAALRWELTEEPDVNSPMIEKLVWRDPKFGIGLSYLNVLRQTANAGTFQPEQSTDLLIGIYFLFHWVGTWEQEAEGYAETDGDA